MFCVKGEIARWFPRFSFSPSGSSFHRLSLTPGLRPELDSCAASPLCPRRPYVSPSQKADKHRPFFLSPLAGLFGPSLQVELKSRGNPKLLLSCRRRSFSVIATEHVTARLPQRRRATWEPRLRNIDHVADDARQLGTPTATFISSGSYNRLNAGLAPSLSTSRSHSMSRGRI